MAAPKLKYTSGNSASTTASSSITDSDTAFPLTSDTNFAAAPTPGEGMIIADEGEATEEFAYATGKSGASLTIPLANRGLEGGSAQAHSSGATIKGILTADMWNDLVESMTNILAQDTGAIDTTKVVTPTGTQTLTNKTLTSPVLNTGVSGTAIVDEDAMTSDSATKVPTQQSVKAYVDARTGDGWLASTDTWTYASASTFTIAGVDRTGVYTKGTRLKFTQTSAKYAVVVSSSFSTDTTVTIAVNTDYTIANAAITAPYYSYMDNPAGYPTHFAYTPAFTGFTGTVPTGTFRYAIIGKTCWVTIFGDTPGTSNATGFTVGVPIAAVSTSAGIATTYDNGAWQAAPGRLSITNGLTAITVTKDAAGAAFTGSGNKTAIFQMVYGC